MSEQYSLYFGWFFSFRTKAFFYLGTIRRFSWNGTTVSHWRFHDNRCMNTSADVSKFNICHHFRVKCWILLKPVLGGVDGNLQFPVSSMNRLNQTEPATFSILLCWTFFRDSVFSLYFIMHYSKHLKRTTGFRSGAFSLFIGL
jgi:hypothetical protein